MSKKESLKPNDMYHNKNTGIFYKVLYTTNELVFYEYGDINNLVLKHHDTIPSFCRRAIPLPVLKTKFRDIYVKFLKYK